VKIKDIKAGGCHCLAISEENKEPNLHSKLYGWGFNFIINWDMGMPKEMII
jgi:hypothetical protein